MINIGVQRLSLWDYFETNSPSRKSEKIKIISVVKQDLTTAEISTTICHSYNGISLGLILGNPVPFPLWHYEYTAHFYMHLCILSDID